jgi:hypothetical protein
MRNVRVRVRNVRVRVRNVRVRVRNVRVRIEACGWEGAVALTSCDFSTSFDVENDTLG